MICGAAGFFVFRVVDFSSCCRSCHTRIVKILNRTPKAPLAEAFRGFKQGILTNLPLVLIPLFA